MDALTLDASAWRAMKDMCATARGSATVALARGSCGGKISPKLAVLAASLEGA